MRKCISLIFILVLMLEFKSLGIVSSVGVVNVDLWCWTSSRVCEVNDIASYSIDVSYIGFKSFLNVGFRVDGLPSDWGWRIVFNGLEVSELRLLNNSRVTVRLDLYVPSSVAPGVYEFNFVCFYAYYPWETTLHLKVVVRGVKEEVSVYCMLPAKVVEAGRTVSFDVDVSYRGTSNIFNLSIPNLPENWNARFYVGSDEVFLLYLKDGAKCTVRVVIDVPSSAEAGLYILNFTIYSSSVCDWIELLIEVTPPKVVNRRLILSVDYPAVSIESGRTAYFTLIIKNAGVFDELVYLNATTVPSGWTVNFRVSGKYVYGLLVPAGSTSNVIVEVTPSPLIVNGTYNFEIEAISQDGLIRDSINLMIRVIGTYGLQISFPELPVLNIRVTSGSSTELTVSVKNTGTLDVTNVEVVVDVPSIDWEVEVKPSKVKVLSSGSEVAFKITLKVSDLVAAGDYFIDVKAISDQVSSKSREIRVTVTKPTEWGYIGIATAIIALIIVFIVFRRIGRR